MNHYLSTSSAVVPAVVDIEAIRAYLAHGHATVRHPRWRDDSKVTCLLFEGKKGRYERSKGKMKDLTTKTTDRLVIAMLCIAKIYNHRNTKTQTHALIRTMQLTAHQCFIVEFCYQ